MKQFVIVARFAHYAVFTTFAVTSEEPFLTHLCFHPYWQGNLVLSSILIGQVILSIRVLLLAFSSSLGTFLSLTRARSRIMLSSADAEYRDILRRLTGFAAFSPTRASEFVLLFCYVMIIRTLLRLPRINFFMSEQTI